MTPRMKTLLEMHTYRRPMFSKSEEAFLDLFFRSLEEEQNVTSYVEDTVGNIIIEVCGGSKTLFCAHSDTVHQHEGRQRIKRKGHLISSHGQHILGADDGAGCWMVREIILAGIPSVCIIARGEESGCVGSRDMAEHSSDFLAQFDRAIAFDRKGKGDVITHQVGGRCCSDEFAQALADALNEHDQMFSPDPSGIFTDTNEWAHLIPECTNLSIGYEGAHTQAETLDVEWLMTMRDAVLKVDWASLPTVRDPKEVRVSKFFLGSGLCAVDPQDEYDLAEMSYREIADWVRKADPTDVASLLISLSDELLNGSMIHSPALNDDDDDTHLDVGLR